MVQNICMNVNIFILLARSLKLLIKNSGMIALLKIHLEHSECFCKSFVHFLSVDCKICSVMQLLLELEDFFSSCNRWHVISSCRIVFVMVLKSLMNNLFVLKNYV